MGEHSVDESRAELAKLLDGVEAHRPLDSLETLTVFSHLKQRGFDVGDDEWDSYPKTVDGWAEWMRLRNTAR